MGDCSAKHKQQLSYKYAVTHAFLFRPCIKRFWNFRKDLEYDFTHVEDIERVMGLEQQGKENFLLS